MKVESEKGAPGDGAILNSRGDRNADAWGKRAEWADYFGPDASGKTVGIAIFDHPSNLRFPTHWHARTYGLMTANRYGTYHFKGNYNDHKTVICVPTAGNNCPACASHSGDYTLAAGKSIVLRNRFYFHHGDPQFAKVAEQYRGYTSDADSIISRMRALLQDRRLRACTELHFAAGPKARNKPAQGNALGKRIKTDNSPEGARQKWSRPFRALSEKNPGPRAVRVPRLPWAGLFAHRSRSFRIVVRVPHRL